MVKGLVRPVPTSAAIQCDYVCLQVQALISASTACLLQPQFFCHWSTLFFLRWQLWITTDRDIIKPYIPEVQSSTLKTHSLQILQNIGGSRATDFTLQTFRSFKTKLYYFKFIVCETQDSSKKKELNKHYLVTWVLVSSRLLISSLCRETTQFNLRKKYSASFGYLFKSNITTVRTF